MSDIWDYSGTPSANTTIEGLNAAPGMTPANVDDVLRAIVAIVRNSLHIDLEPFLKGSAALPLASGGTGATTAGAALTALGGLEDDYRDLQPVVKSAAFAFADADRGKAIRYNGAATAATINPNSTTAITSGAAFVIRNVGSGTLTVTRGSGVSLNVNGANVSSDAALAVGGVATLIRWGADDWTITGAGLS
jgi:hypothetical protein